MALMRISVTIPKHILEAADSRARDLDRSRSWLVAEALRRLLGLQQASAAADRYVPRVRDVAPGSRPAQGMGALGEYRQRQLDADLAMSPDERVAAAENTALVARLRRTSWQRDRVLTFDRYDDYLDWKSWEESPGG
jgi:hypothetical protein